MTRIAAKHELTLPTTCRRAVHARMRHCRVINANSHEPSWSNAGSLPLACVKRFNIISEIRLPTIHKIGQGVSTIYRKFRNNLSSSVEFRVWIEPRKIATWNRNIGNLPYLILTYGLSLPREIDIFYENKKYFSFVCINLSRA